MISATYPTPASITRACAKMLKLNVAAIRGKQRSQELTTARQLISLAARKLGYTFDAIAESTQYSRTTAYKWWLAADERVLQDKKFRALYFCLRQRISFLN